MVVPHDNARVRSIPVTQRLVRGVVGLVAVLALLASTFTIGFFVKESQHLRADRLLQENRMLTSEVERIRGDLETLGRSVTALTEKDEKFRAVAGLSPIDEQVRAVGVGGPGTPTLETSSLYEVNADAGEAVFAARYDLGMLLRRASLLHSSMDEALATMERNTERLAATPSIAPASGHLSSLFSPNRRHPVLRITRPHEGIDIAAPVGEPILAPAAGTVVFAGMRSGGYGNTVQIDHGHGIKTLYAHASRILVRRGDRVERGQTIAEVGATGLVTGPHLHYEVEIDGKPVDPLQFIVWDGIVED